MNTVDRKIKGFTNFAWVLFAVGIASLAFGVCYFIFQSSDFKLADFGTYCGGAVASVWSLAGIMFIYVAFLGQKQQLVFQQIEIAQNQHELVLTRAEFRTQNEHLEMQSFESRFFEMVKAHRQMVYEMEFITPDEYKIIEGRREETVITGPKVFSKIYKQLETAYEFVKPIYEEFESNVFKSQEKENDEKTIIIDYYKSFDDKKFKQMNLLGLSYQITLYGVDGNGERILRTMLGKSYSENFIDVLITELKLMPAKHDKHWDDYKAKDYSYQSYPYTKYFGGHIHRLGQYFRLLFNLVHYVNDSKKLTYDEKYSFINFLRSQLSTYEQAVFFANSLAPIGRVWELKAREFRIEWQTLENKRLITKYNLIRNIPADFIEEIDIESFYPLVDYESKEVSPEKLALFGRYT